MVCEVVVVGPSSSGTDIPVCPFQEKTIAVPAHGPVGLPLVETRSLCSSLSQRTLSRSTITP